MIGFMDGLSLYTKFTLEIIQQNAIYNGYHSDTLVNNVIAYGADEKFFLWIEFSWKLA